MKVLLNSDDLKKFPNCPKSFPMELFNEDQALKIHGQSLKRLNERGGLHPKEMLCNLLKVDYKELASLELGLAIKILVLYEQR